MYFLPNIPTEEVFTAPHKDKVNGVVYGTKPYVFNGQLIKGFHVTFQDGKVVEHGAEEGAAAGAAAGHRRRFPQHRRSGLVPASSPINRSGALFYSTLFDENAACHIAFGASYPGTTEGGTALTKEELLARGMNQSAIHEDVMIGAEDSHITGKCRDGRTVEPVQRRSVGAVKAFLTKALAYFPEYGIFYLYDITFMERGPQGPRFLFVWRFLWRSSLAAIPPRESKRLSAPPWRAWGCACGMLSLKKGAGLVSPCADRQDGRLHHGHRHLRRCLPMRWTPSSTRQTPLSRAIIWRWAAPALGRKLTRPNVKGGRKGAEDHREEVPPKGIRYILTLPRRKYHYGGGGTALRSFEASAASTVRLCDDEDLFDWKKNPLQK